MENLETLLYKKEVSVSLSTPRPLECFSVDKNRKLMDNDLNCLRYFIYPELPLDLNDGFKSFIKKPDTAKHEGLKHLLEFVLKKQLCINYFSSKTLDVDFICFRGLLSLLMRTPYEKQSWTVCAVRWKGAIYLCEFDKCEYSFEKAELFNYYGHKFEQYTLSNSPHNNINKNEPVNECEEFCVVFESFLNDFKLLYGAEVDGIISDITHSSKSFLTNANFVELKTNRLIDNQQQQFSFQKHKLLKFWTQSFLVGIKTIMVGYRSDSGILKKILPLQVSDIPKTCERFCKKKYV
ncbi:decapping nuclease DXO homolog [Agrilus planipennis]|uniref:Decapping nuclease n=1 Tax=Agrilus planipennis TaxID=224129 RepID=A0A7F5REF2_AGRPL|nr:decapping nuclease DXO homolog [Agrilus planipennis]